MYVTKVKNDVNSRLFTLKKRYSGIWLRRAKGWSDIVRKHIKLSKLGSPVKPCVETQRSSISNHIGCFSRVSKILSVSPFMSLDVVNPLDVPYAMKSLNKFRHFMTSQTSRETLQEKIC